MKRVFIGIALLALSARVVADNRSVAGRFDLVEATIPSIQAAIQDNIINAEQLVQMYLARIAAYDAKTTATRLNSYIHVNADAVREAREANKGRANGYQKGPLFGIPVILKDNIDTKKMPTTAGSVAFAGSIPQSDAFVTQKLLDAGAIIIGKATMTEFANFLTNGMPAGYNSLAGYGYNPYDPRPDPRTALDALGRPFNDGRPALTPGGSSSGPGIAVAANLAAVGIGTETSGSILSPGTANMLVGIKPTVGLISRDGIIPITADQDTAGPMTRTVRDAAIVLGVIAGFDPKDPATAACLTPGNCFSDYTQFLDADALAGARIAVPPFPANRATVMNNAIATLTAQGATVMIVNALAAQLPGCPSRPPAANYPPSPRRPARGAPLLDGAQLRLQARSQPVHPGPRSQSVPDPVVERRRHVQRPVRSGRDEVRPGPRDLLRVFRHLPGQLRHAPLPGRPRRRHHAVARRDRRGAEWTGYPARDSR